jgi:acyl-coenzyme A thioesterase PaaI-like protein
VTAPATRLLRHYPGCYGCGTDNHHGLGLAVRWDGSEGVIDHVPPTEVEGGPGIVHGGYLGLIADELMALVACEVAGAPAMTKRLELTFRSPALTSRPLRIRAWVEELDGRTLVVRLSATPAGRTKPCFQGRGEFVVVPTERWIRSARSVGRSPDRLTWNAGDPSNFLRWQLQGLNDLFRPERLQRPVRLALSIEDADPGDWTISAGSDAISASQGHEPGCDAHFRGTFRDWQAVLHGITAPDGGPLDALVAALEFKENAP